MANYTIQVRTICESFLPAGFHGTVDEVLDETWDKVIDFNFPIFSEQYRKTLCRKILKHYFMREIGLETVGLWKLYLNTRLNEIMPYYNKLYTSELIQFDPLSDTDITTRHTGKNERDVISNTDTDSSSSNTSSASSSSTDGEINKFSDTPQSSLSGVESGTYLTNARKIENSHQGSSGGTASGTANIDTGYTENSTDDITWEETIKGKSQNNGKTFAEILKQYRDTFLNVDLMVIHDLNDLFIGLLD